MDRMGMELFVGDTETVTYVDSENVSSKPQFQPQPVSKTSWHQIHEYVSE